VRELVERGRHLELGGEERRVTILFSDLAGFTTLAETLPPVGVVALLNEYLGAMTEVIYVERGTVGDFVGDAVLAYWGAPTEQPHQAARACRAALAMQSALTGLNARLGARGLPALNQRIGIHTGEVIVGNIGSEQHREFTVIGDAVNLASRLEGANKRFGTGILVSGDTLAETDGAFVTRELARVVVQGRAAPVAVHELRAVQEPPAAGTSSARQRSPTYAEALEMFYTGELRGARAGFLAAWEQDADAAARFMAAQCGALLAAPLPQPWDGALRLSEK
jgi:adenylate cyclase